MNSDFWLDKWARKEIAFHQAQANPLLVQHFATLGLAPGSRVFLPLCGKTLDIAWLLASGYRVLGAELSEIAIEELFLELGIKPEVKPAGKLCHYRGGNLDAFVGDIFDLSAGVLGPVDAIYDRAALVALPEGMRGRYAKHLIQITSGAPQFLIVFEYAQQLMAGPPFSVDEGEVRRHYAGNYQLRCIESAPVAGGLKGVPAAEHAWLLTAS